MMDFVLDSDILSIMQDTFYFVVFLIAYFAPGLITCTIYRWLFINNGRKIFVTIAKNFVTVRHINKRWLIV